MTKPFTLAFAHHDLAILDYLHDHYRNQIEFKNLIYDFAPTDLLAISADCFLIDRQLLNKKAWDMLYEFLSEPRLNPYELDLQDWQAHGLSLSDIDEINQPKTWYLFIDELPIALPRYERCLSIPSSAYSDYQHIIPIIDAFISLTGTQTN